MAYEKENFTFTSGATGSFSFYGNPGSPVQPAFTTGPGALTGTFNGQQITGFSSYGNPNNAVLGPGDGNAQYVASVNGIYTNKADANDPSQPNGVSFTLADGSSVHIYVHDIDGLGHYMLMYQTSNGASGTVQVAHTEDFNVDAPCFAAGSLIRAAVGETAVEQLREGDLVLTHAGAARRVKWVGHTVVHPRRSPEPWNLHPIRIRANAVADGVPCRDLLVSPGHALLIGDVLINAGELVNGGTIVQEEVERVDYYHVELDSHDILIADGMPCESYLDDGNRASFLNGSDHIRLHGRIDRASEATCRPLVKDGPLLIEAREKLLARALATGWELAERPELRVQIGDALIAPVAVAGARWWFLLPDAAPGVVRLHCAAAMPARIVPGHPDGRRLGVALGEVRIDGEPVALDSPRLAAGFHPPESDGASAWRWMDGDAALTVGAGARMIELRVQIVLPTLWRSDAAVAHGATFAAAGG